MNLGLCRPFSWRLILTDIGVPILGEYFLCHHRLLVDMQRRSLKDLATSLLSSGKITTCSNDNILSIISEVAAIQFSLYQPVKYIVQHHIITIGSPIFPKVRPLPPEKLSVAQKEFEQLFKQGICRSSSSSWSSQPHLVPKRPFNPVKLKRKRSPAFRRQRRSKISEGSWA